MSKAIKCAVCPKTAKGPLVELLKHGWKNTEGGLICPKCATGDGT